MASIKELKQFNNIKKSVFFKIFALTLLPMTCISLISLSTYYYYIRFFENDIKANYLKSLSISADSINNTMYEIYKINNLLSLDEKLIEVANFEGDLQGAEYYRLIDSVKTLVKFKVTKDLIDNVFILQKSNQLVISSDGVMTVDRFFNEYYHYKQYDDNFWLNLSNNFGTNKMLDRSQVEQYEYTGNKKIKSIIPIVLSNFGDQPLRNLVVINMNEAVIKQLMNKHKLTENSMLFITNHNRHVISYTDKHSYVNPADHQALLEKIVERKNDTFQAEFAGKKTLVITYANEAMANDFIYVACVPYSDIYKKSAYIKNIAYLISAVSLLASIVISFMMSKKIYSPIRNLVYSVNKKMDTFKQVSSDDEFDYLNRQFSSVVNESEKLTEDLSFALPFISEQYLLKILNQNKFFFKERINEFMAKANLTFQYPYFAVTIIQFTFKEEFYLRFSNEEQLLVYGGIPKIAMRFFPEQYRIHILMMEKDKLCIIINLPEMDSLQSIVQSMKNIDGVFDNDNNLVQVHSGIGRIYSDLTGIHKSYTEAVKALSSITLFEREKVKVYMQEGSYPKYDFSFEEENKLSNFLMSGYKDKVNELLDQIIEKNIAKNISDTSTKELFLQLYLIGVHVMNRKGLSAEEIMGNRYIPFSDCYSQRSQKELAEYVAVFFEQIIMHKGKDKRADIAQLKAFIDNHYHEDIYLEQLADLNSVTPAYLSRLLKESLGMTFQNYLAKLRIDAAKKLLQDTNKTINEIAPLVGFNSRNTFIRMFKKLEGITPSEFRALKP
ncbi:helix-turn-helix domain-containing protein [Paenibacillus sp. GCM10027626]|uniref:helix-turn-helix domain-containing protein n=1 Tax=Paenibacillus sp. GCM10027626 TaxID=3273411 RepID=UPI0036D40B0D